MRQFLVSAILLLAYPSVPAAEVKPLINGHAHNDYAQKRPLLDALDQGFGSIEADIHLNRDELLVGHDYFDLRPGKTLQKLYLDPLRERVRANGGRVYRHGPSIILLIDLKTPAEKTYLRLDEVLRDYAEMLSEFDGQRLIERAVTAVISGNRPIEMMKRQERRFACLDGRLTDLRGSAPLHLIPLVSDNWRDHFTWRGVGPFPEAEHAKLEGFVRQAHAQGRKLRFWAAPDVLASWKEQRAAGVDLINTDKLAELRQFLMPD